jgi:molybdenum cofactor cytidylyltransferase
MIAALVLAAGGSSRMGGPKQLIELDGKTLLRRAVETAIASQAGYVVVVLGHQWERTALETEGLDATVVVNPEWQAGMSSSLRAGLQALPDDADAALITLCDQPLVTPENLRDLLALFAESGKPVAACRYAGALGVPAVFARTLFPELMDLSGDVGARKILQAHARDAAVMELPDAAIDLDTPIDLNSFSAKQH